MIGRAGAGVPVAAPAPSTLESVRIDPHTHSDASDGTDRPAGVVAAAAAAGLDVVGLTDHDTTAGWAEAADAARRHGVALLRGIELTARAEGTSVHVLAYLPDPDDPALVALTERTREDRVGRAHRIVDRLAADHPITWQDVVAHIEPGATVGRPHIADTLVALGMVADRGEAFASLLATGSPYYVAHGAPGAATVVRAVRAAGGVPVVAHPGAMRGEPLSEATLEELVGAGLLGIEVDHAEHDDATRARLRAFASRAGLLVTGGSDYHGTGKPNRIGENTTVPEVYQAIVAAGRIGVVA